MNPHQIHRLFPNASRSVIEANHADYSGPDSKLESNPRGNPLATHSPKETSAERIHLRVVSVRKRLCDPDNLSPKWIIDALRYIGAISGDEPENISLEVAQRKAAKGEEEHTQIDITYP